MNTVLLEKNNININVPPVHCFSLEEYHRLAEIGILSEDDRVELIDGRIIDMTPIGSKHASCVTKLNHIFESRLKGSFIVSIQNPVQLSSNTEFEPDIAILKFKKDFYAEKLPEAKDVELIIEVADSSLNYDRDIKIPLYAKANINEVWLVNLIEMVIEIYTEPSSEGYNLIKKCRQDETVSSKSLSELKIPVNEVLFNR